MTRTFTYRYATERGSPMRSSFTGLAGAILLGAIIIATSLLVALDKLEPDLYMGVVVGPIVGGVVGVVGVTRGVQQGAQAAVSPPPGG